jgi:hypothetical protein
MERQISTYKIKDSIVEILFYNKLDFSISELLSAILNNNETKKTRFLILNFEKATFITLPAALYIISFSSYFKTRETNLVKSEINKLNKDLLPFLMSIGFFSTLVTRAGFVFENAILSEERNLITQTKANQRSIILPVSIVEFSNEKTNFEDYTRNFVRKFGQFFQLLTQSPTFNFENSPDELQELWEALYENIKNIFDHSKSEGIGSIQASTNLGGTTICFFDTGIGIAQSVMDSSQINIHSETEAIDWALIDGNSSKIKGKAGKNLGHGFQIMKRFTDKRNGILTLRTGTHLFTYRNKQWKNSLVNWFPGTQIIIYTPIIQE